MTENEKYQTAIPVIILGKLVTIIGLGTVIWMIFYSEETRSFIYHNPALRLSLIGIAITCFITTTVDIRHRLKLKKLNILREQEAEAKKQFEENLKPKEEEVDYDNPPEFSEIVARENAKVGLNGVTFNGLAGAKNPEHTRKRK